MESESFFTYQFGGLSELSPSEQAVYVRLLLMAENGKTRGRYEDIAKLSHVSVSTFRRVVKSLAERGLVEVVWRQKTPSLFILKEKTRARAEAKPKIYDSFTPEGRELFLFAKRAVPPAEMKALQKEADEEGKDFVSSTIFHVYRFRAVAFAQKATGERGGGKHLFARFIDSLEVFHRSQSYEQRLTVEFTPIEDYNAKLAGFSLEEMKW